MALQGAAALPSSPGRPSRLPGVAEAAGGGGRARRACGGLPAHASALSAGCAAAALLGRGGLGARRRERAARRAAAGEAAAPRREGVFRLRGRESKRYLRALQGGEVLHDEAPSSDGLFALVPGTGAATGLVQLHHLASDRDLFMTEDGLLGCFHGASAEFWWSLRRADGEAACFRLQNYATGMVMYSSADGRLGGFGGKDFGDQLFCLEDVAGSSVGLEAAHGCFGLHDTGFRWEGHAVDPTLYTDAFNAGHYLFDEGETRLLEVREYLKAWGPLTWGSAEDLCLAEMERPHAWALERIPLLRRLAGLGLISAGHRRNEVFPPEGPQDEGFSGAGVRPSNAVKFAVRPVSDGRRVRLERGWVRAWHGTSLGCVESILRGGLQGGTWPREDGSPPPIWLTPSFRYAFCLYSLPDLDVDGARLRLVVEARVRRGAVCEHGDAYAFCDARLIEGRVPAERLEWEVDRASAGSVQVVGLVLKQLCPRHPTLRHDCNIRACSKALLRL